MKIVKDWGLLLVGAAALALSLSGCQRGAKGAATSGSQGERRDTRIVHEDCPLKAAEHADANGDGNPEVSVVRRGGKDVCHAFDGNNDGLVDSWVYFGADGLVRRRERAYGRDNRIMEIRIYDKGQVKEIHQATAMLSALDTWHFYQNGALVRTERDANGDGIIDEWWEYPQGADCPVMYTDANGNGAKDESTLIDFCKEIGKAPVASRDGRAVGKPDFRPEEEQRRERAERARDSAPAPPQPEPAAKPEDGKGAEP